MYETFDSYRDSTMHSLLLLLYSTDSILYLAESSTVARAGIALSGEYLPMASKGSQRDLLNNSGREIVSTLYRARAFRSFPLEFIRVIMIFRLRDLSWIAALRFLDSRGNRRYVTVTSHRPRDQDLHM
jgi:hypothetical protein